MIWEGGYVALADWYYVFCLWALGALGNCHFDFLPFAQSATTISLYCAVMHEYILAASLFDETKSFLVIKPFDGAFNLLSHISL